MPEIYGLPAGEALRHLGIDPHDWHKRMELRAQVVAGMGKAPKTKTRKAPNKRKASERASAGDLARVLRNSLGES